MADNFNLRSFLTENKLTKNAQLLNEFGAQDISTLGWEALEQSTDPEVKKLLADYKVSLSADYDACDASPECRNHMGISPQYFNPSSNKTIAIQKELAKLATEKGIDVKQQAPPAKPAETAKALGFWDKIKAKVGLKEEDLEEADWRNNPYTPHNFDGVAKQAQQSKEIQAVANRMFPEFGGELENLGAPLTPDQRNAVWATWSKEKVAREKAEREAIQETLTAKERRLVEMVEDALGIAPQAVAEEAPIAEDEMANETVIPEYKNIEELLKGIEEGTNKVAEEHKIQEMKKIAEALRMKAKKMEESEHAAHISPKDLKQLATDAAKLEKAAEKLKAAFDKKFNKKEKASAAPKAEKVEALQENIMENFNLKKFLVENKLTTNSRMLNEKLSYDDFEQMIKPFLDLAKSKGWVWNSSGNSWYDMSSPAIALFHKDVVPTTKDGEYKGQPTELGTNPVAGRSMNVRGPLETKSADVIMSPDYNIEQAYFSAKDKTILDSIKGAMANNTDVIQDIKQTSSEFTSGGDFEPQNYYVMLLRKKGA